MNAPSLNKFTTFFLVTTLFVIPISPTFKSIFILLSAASILSTPEYRNNMLSLCSQSWCRSALVFFVVVLLACLWSAASHHTQLIMIEKYSKLLYLPILVFGFRSRNVRMMGIYAFLLAMFITCILSLCKDSGLIQFNTADPGQIFHNHIVTSYMMAFAAYLSGLLMRTQEKSYLNNARRILFSLLLVLFSYNVLFVNTGRTGYVLYFVLMILLLIQSLPLKYLAIAVLSFCAFFTVSIYQSAVLSTGFHNIVENLQQYKQGSKDTPVGYRLMFHQYAKSLFLSSPLWGQGTGGFLHSFQRDNPVPTWKDNNLLDPHSQYWLVAAEFGLLGLAMLFYFFISLLSASFRLREMQPVMLGLLASFLLGNLSDSLLLYSVVGYLFILFSALCLGELMGHSH